MTAGDRASAGCQQALASLCESYWHPVYAFVRRNGYNKDDASDLTQSFFQRALEKDLLRTAHPDRGRFRSFLLTAVRHFLANDYDRRRALKRGGDRPHLSLDFDAEEHRYQLESINYLTPEHLYERRWATRILETTMERLAASYEKSPRRNLFERLRPFLTDARTVPSAELASELSMSGGAVRVALHRLRRQYGTVLRQTIAETVERPEDVDRELRYLADVISR